MPSARNVTPLALVTLVVVVVATLLALGGSKSMGPVGPKRPAGTTTNARSVPAKRRAADPAVGVARRYALAARNWTAATYEDAWERQIKLAGGGYRRGLIAKRPGRRELIALRSDGARSEVRVVRFERDRHVRLPTARVLVVLDETTHAGGQRIQGETLNEVRLRWYRVGWRVVGWTVIPGG
jgi:hypothetical protein